MKDSEKGSGQSEEDYMERCEEYLEKEDYGKAITETDRALELFPDSEFFYAVRGEAHRSLGDLERALEDFGELIRLDPEDGSAYSMRGMVYADTDQGDKALADFEKALALDPDVPETHYGLGLAYILKDEYDLAIGSLSTAIAMDGEQAIFYLKRGMAYMFKGDLEKNAEDYRKALEDCRNAVDMGMDFPDVRAYVSMILHKLGQSDKAIRECDDIIGQYPENAMAYAFRSLIYGDKGDGNRAEADRRKTLELDPELIWMFGKNGSLPEADG